MITIKETELKNKLSEFTIKEYELITEIFNSDIPTISKYLDIITIAGLKDENILAELSYKDLKEYIESISVTEETFEFVRSFEINGRTYSAYKENKEFELNARDSEKLEIEIKKNPNKYILFACALLFKDEQLTNNEHKDISHIKHKKTLFENLPASYIQPYIIAINETLISKLEYSQEQLNLQKIMNEYDKQRKDIKA